MNSTRMRLGMLALATAATIASLPATQTFAQQPSNQKQTQANQTTDWNALTNVRIEIFKAALQLNPDQQKYWPAVEQAIRATEQAWHQQGAAVTEGRGQQPASDPVQRLRNRANSMAQRADDLKKLADAWQPLYQTLSPDQKQRAHLLSMDMFRDLRGVVMAQRFERFQRRIERFGQTG